MLASEYVFPHLECVGKFHLGVLLVEQGRLEEGLTMARDGMAAVDNLGSHIFSGSLARAFCAGLRFGRPLGRGSHLAGGGVFGSR